MVEDDNIRTMMDFWYRFDDYFFGAEGFHSPPEIVNAIRKLHPYVKLRRQFLVHHGAGTLDSGFKAELEQDKEIIELLAKHHLRIIDECFIANKSLVQTAFEYFGQGLLYDNLKDENNNYRRPEGWKVHMMDADIGGFLVWHAFIRAVVISDVLGKDLEERWLQIDRYIALAAALLAESIRLGNKPKQGREVSNDGDPHNKGIEGNEQLLSELQNTWLNKSFSEIDSSLIQLVQSTS